MLGVPPGSWPELLKALEFPERGERASFVIQNKSLSTMPEFTRIYQSSC